MLISQELISKVEAINAEKGLPCLDDIYARDLQDIDVKNFMEKYDISTDSDTYKYGKSVIHSFIRSKNDPRYYPRLVLVDGRIGIVESFRSQQLEEFYLTRPKQRYDKSTQWLSDLTMKNAPFNIGNSKAVEYLNSALVDVYNKKGAWIVGSMGIGKSTLIGCFVGTLKARNIAFEFLGVNNFLNELKELMNQQGSNLEKRKNELINVPILIFDDIGVEQPTPWNLRTLQDIISARFDRKSPTYFTSNLTKDDYLRQYEKAVNGAVVQRYRKKAIEPIAQEVQMSGKDWRNHDGR